MKVPPNIYAEQPGSNSASMARDLARHLYMRINEGTVIIVADKPVVLLSTLKKQWFKLTRQVHRERASTLDAVKISTLTRNLIQMHNLHFTCKDCFDRPQANVFIIPADELASPLPKCATLYICAQPDPDLLILLFDCMPLHSLVVDYT